MSASKGLPIYLMLAWAVVLSSSGCSKEVKADFPRPPATAGMPPLEEMPEPEAPAPAPAEPETAPENESAAEIEPEPAPPPEPAPRRPPRAAPEAPPVEVEEPEPPSTQLAGAEEVDPELASKLRRASSLLGFVSTRRLTTAQSQQFTAAEAFVTQAREALTEGDQRRAHVLIDKGLILARDVERLSRP